MPRKAPELSALHVRRLTTPGLHAVGGVAGLAMQVAPGGARTWILRVSIAGRRRDMGLGGYPDVELGRGAQGSVAHARCRRGREKLNRAIAAGLMKPESKARLAAQGSEVVAAPAAEFGDFIKKEIVKWREVVKASGAKMD